jgi:Xaa-Pro aminopeptidase
VFTSSAWWSLANTALKAIEKRLQPVDDLVGRIWPSNDRPKASQKPIIKHNIEYAGENVTQKLLRTTTELKRVGATATIISALDEVAWQFNLRGADIPYNPFFKSYAIIYADTNIRQPKLFVNLTQLNSNIYPVGVNVFDYTMFWSHLNETATDPTIRKIWVSSRVSQAILGLIPDNKLPSNLLNSPVQRIKARKNPVERKGMKDCQIRDAVARMKHIGWIEQQLNKGIPVNETQSADQLFVYQKQQDKFQFPSFDAISASGDRAAVIHYSPVAATARPITKDRVYLLDVNRLI